MLGGVTLLDCHPTLFLITQRVPEELYGLEHPLVEKIFRILGIFQVNSLFKIVEISDPLGMICAFESSKGFLIFNGLSQSGKY